MKYLISVCLPFSGLHSLSAQQIPFPVDNAEWISSHESNYCVGGSNIYYLWLDYLEGDTIIQNSTYHKLWFMPECYHANTGVNCTGTYGTANGGPYLIGGIREEGSRVIFQKFDVPHSIFNSYEQALADVPAFEDVLLYDYDWMIGDSFSLPLISGYHLMFKVSEIGLENGRKRSRVTRSQGQAFSYDLYEGMGAKQGLFGLYYSPVGSYLPLDICFYHNGQLIQQGENCLGCGIVGNKEPEPLHDIKIFPSPSSDIIFIESDPSEGPFILQVFNIEGKLLYTDRNYIGNSTLSTRSLGISGLLQIVLTDKNGSTSIGKVLIL